MSSQDMKAEDEFQAGKKALDRSGLKTLFGGGSSKKYEDALDHFEKAGNFFKVAKNWHRAGETFEQIAICHEKLDSPHDAASALTNAATAYKKVDAHLASDCMKRAVQIFVDMGRFNMAAKYQKDLAELYEGESDWENALQAYQQAADYFSGEDSTSAANQCLLKVATISAVPQEDYKRAADLFEQIASEAVDNNLLKWGAKEHLLKAGLCRLSAKQDLHTVRAALDKYSSLDPSFQGSRECKLLTEAVTALQEQDEAKYTKAVGDFDSILPLDSWKTTVLLKIKKERFTDATDDADGML